MNAQMIMCAVIVSIQTRWFSMEKSELKEYSKISEKLALIKIAKEILDNNYDTVSQVMGHLYSEIGKLEKEIKGE